MSSNATLYLIVHVRDRLDSTLIMLAKMCYRYWGLIGMQITKQNVKYFVGKSNTCSCLQYPLLQKIAFVPFSSMYGLLFGSKVFESLSAY